MNQFYKKLLLTTFILIILNTIYLYVSKEVFEHQVIDVQRVIMQRKMDATLFYYILLISGLFYFIINKNKSPLDAFFLGIFINGIYELKNYSIFKKWSLFLVFIDTLWGGILFAKTTYLTYMLSNF
jgi:uncharacterized membrane protein